MSIHTILSQMEGQVFGHGEEVIEISIYRKDGKILSIPYHTVKKGLEVFAIRIVEEVIEELVLADYFDKDMRWTKIHELIKMRVPISASDRDYYMKPFTDIRTKLQKMKEI